MNLTKPQELKTIQDIIKYWQKCLSNPKNLSDVQVAYDMVCVVGAGIFGEYYEEKADQDFIAVFDNVADLEIPQGSESGVKKHGKRYISI